MNSGSVDAEIWRIFISWPFLNISFWPEFLAWILLSFLMLWISWIFASACLINRSSFSASCIASLMFSVWLCDILLIVLSPVLRTSSISWISDCIPRRRSWIFVCPCILLDVFSNSELKFCLTFDCKQTVTSWRGHKKPLRTQNLTVKFYLTKMKSIKHQFTN